MEPASDSGSIFVFRLIISPHENYYFPLCVFVVKSSSKCHEEHGFEGLIFPSLIVICKAERVVALLREWRR
jgi:hypothetical protein